MAGQRHQRLCLGAVLLGIPAGRRRPRSEGGPWPSSSFSRTPFPNPLHPVVQDRCRQRKLIHRQSSAALRFEDLLATFLGLLQAMAETRFVIRGANHRGQAAPCALRRQSRRGAGDAALSGRRSAPRAPVNARYVYEPVGAASPSPAPGPRRHPCCRGFSAAVPQRTSP